MWAKIYSDRKIAGTYPYFVLTLVILMYWYAVGGVYYT